MAHEFSIFLAYFPILAWSCGSDISGSSSNTAEFDISFFAPLSYTYPPSDSDLIPGQSLTLQQANQKVKTDLELAISKALTSNQLYLSAPPTVNFTFTPQKLLVVDGEVCLTDGTYVAISGTVIYQCTTGGSTASPATGPTQSPGSTASTTQPSITTTEDQVGEDMDLMRAFPRQRAASGVKAQPFVQTMTVVANAVQPLFESQWKQIGRSVQSALEAKKLLFNDEIGVLLL